MNIHITYSGEITSQIYQKIKNDMVDESEIKISNEKEMGLGIGEALFVSIFGALISHQINKILDILVEEKKKDPEIKIKIFLDDINKVYEIPKDIESIQSEIIEDEELD